MPPEPFALCLDIASFARAGELRAGQENLASFARLLAEVGAAGAPELLTWQARGERRLDQAGLEQLWLHLRVDVTLPLVCQRCLALVAVPLHLTCSFRFVASEEQAWAQDEHALEDVLVLSPAFDLAALIEDEVLMGLPLVARHDVCPGKVPWASGDLSDPPDSACHPFAALSKLRGLG
jgi:uncharacterized protein